MIYLDNAATTLHKPPEVAEAVKNAILTAGNAGSLRCLMQKDRNVWHLPQTQQKL